VEQEFALCLRRLVDVTPKFAKQLIAKTSGVSGQSAALRAQRDECAPVIQLQPLKRGQSPRHARQGAQAGRPRGIIACQQTIRQRDGRRRTELTD
jgi:hypothetical protein